MEHKQNVLIVHNYYQIPGGEDTVVANEAKLLQDHGHAVTLYTRDNKELTKMSKLKKLLLPFAAIFNIKTYREVRCIMKQKNIDVVHVHNTLLLISPSVYYAAISCKVPVVQTVHNFRFLCPNGIFFCKGQICEKCNEKFSFRDAIKNKCYRGSRLQTILVAAILQLHRILGTYKKISYIFLTDFNRQKFAKLIDINSDRVFIKPNFVSDSTFFPTTQQENSFVFAGRLEKEKGIKTLITFWKELPTDHVLYIFGDGSLKSYVEANASGNIIYRGFQSRDVIAAQLSCSKALIFPSIWYEGFPMTIAESLSLGCPVVSTDIGNGAEIVKNSGGGELFSACDYCSFRSALDQVKDNYDNYSQNAKLFYENWLSSEVNYVALLDIYRKVKTFKVDTK